MSTFTLAISCLTTSNLPWFMDLTFQVPIPYCSLQHQTLLSTQVTSTTWCCFCFGSISSFFLELFPHFSLVKYWAPTDLGSSSFSVLPFCLFILFMGFSRQECWSGLPFPSPVGRLLSELSTMTCPSCAALHSMAHSHWVRHGCTALRWWPHGTAAVSTWYWGNCEGIPHVQGQRSPSTTVGAGVVAEQSWSSREEITHFQGQR